MSPLAGIKSIKDLPLENKTVFMRVDFNVPLEEGVITDDSRIREALPSIKHALERGARVVLASHLGRPKPGKTAGLSLEPCGVRLAELLGVEVHLPDDCIGDAPKKVVHDLRAGQVCLLENLRFHPEEEKNDEVFAQKLAELADVYVDDAFGAVHRAHASVAGIAKHFRDRGCGFLLEREIAALGKLTTDPEKPYVAVLGGAILGALGLIAGLWAEKFDQLAAFQNFLIMPLTMLSGVFYSIHSLPVFWQRVSHYNPVFYMIDGFRYGFFGVSDIAPEISLGVVLASFAVVSLLTLSLLKRGWKLRA